MVGSLVDAWLDQLDVFVSVCDVCISYYGSALLCLE